MELEPRIQENTGFNELAFGGEDTKVFDKDDWEAVSTMRHQVKIQIKAKAGKERRKESLGFRSLHFQRVEIFVIMAKVHLVHSSLSR